MLGGGFIGQMHQTNKQNREMLKREGSKTFSRTNIFDDESKSRLGDHKKLTEEERIALLNTIRLQEKSQDKRKLFVLLVLVVASGLLSGILLF